MVQGWPPLGNYGGGGGGGALGPSSISSRLQAHSSQSLRPYSFCRVHSIPLHVYQFACDQHAPSHTWVCSIKNSTDSNRPTTYYYSHSTLKNSILYHIP